MVDSVARKWQRRPRHGGTTLSLCHCMAFSLCHCVTMSLCHVTSQSMVDSVTQVAEEAKARRHHRTLVVTGETILLGEALICVAAAAGYASTHISVPSDELPHHSQAIRTVCKAPAPLCARCACSSEES